MQFPVDLQYVCCSPLGGAVQVPQGHQQQTGRARLAPQQSQEIHRRQEPRPGLWAGRTGVSVCLCVCTCYIYKLSFILFSCLILH